MTSSASCKVEGDILINGEKRNLKKFRRQSCYVLQQDVLLSSATVKESVATSALLKLPMSLTKKDKIERVNRILEELNLTDCQNTLIGNELLGIKGVSGGQKRRVSIGIELVKDPIAIFLDEPSSGLDSEMAVSLVENLVEMCRNNRTVVLTIHQPNSLITSKFDDFMLLADGKVVYFGAWEDAVSFFSEVGLHCPQFMNPTDFFIHALNDKSKIDVLADHQKVKDAAKIDIELGEKDVQKLTESEKEDDGKDESERPQVPMWYQAKILAGRHIRSYLRNPAMLVSETAQYLFMGLFVGLMYLQLSNNISTGVQDRLASIWFGMAVLSFTPSYTAVTVWDSDRVLLRRESGQGMYTVASWYIAKSMVSIPLQIIQTLLFGFVAYFMVGYKITFTNVLIYLAGYALFQITSESIGVICAAVTTTSTYAVLVLTFTLLILLSFSGFLVSDVPVYFRWVTKISYLTYAFAAIGISQFDSTTFVCDVQTPECQQGSSVPGSSVIPSSIDNGLSPGINLVVLLGITVGCRILGYLAILGAKKINFL